MSKAFLTLMAVFLLLGGLQNCQNKPAEKQVAYKDLLDKSERYTRAEYDSVLAFYRQLDQINTSQRSPVVFYLKKYIQAHLNFRNAQYEQSNKNLFEAIGYAQQIENADTLVAKSYSVIGKNFTHENKFDTAFYYFHKALKIYDRKKDEVQKNRVKTYMANAYYFKGDIPQATVLIEEVIKNAHDPQSQLSALHQKANILGSSGAVDQAIELDNQVINNYQHKVNPTLLSPFYNNLGLCYSAKNDLDKAIEYVSKSVRLDSISGIKINAISNLVLLADISLAQNKIAQAEKYNYRALKFFTEHNSYDKKLGLYQSLENILRQKNDLKGVMACKDSILSMVRKMNTAQDNNTINLLKIEYETDQKNHQIIQQQHKIETQQRLVLFVSIAALLILLVLYFIYQNHQKKNKLAILEQENKISDMVFEAEQTERKRIASDLHNGINQKLAVISMYLSSDGETASEKSKLAASIVQETIADVRTISHNLYPTDLNKGLLLALRALCEQNNYLNASVKFELNYDQNLEQTWSLNKEIELVMFRVIQELLNNALKHAQASWVSINIASSDKKIKFMIQDNGIGIPSENNPSGIGLKNCIGRIELLQGKMTLTTAEPQGTQIHIEIPR